MCVCLCTPNFSKLKSSYLFFFQSTLEKIKVLKENPCHHKLKMADDSSSVSSDNEEQQKTDEPTTIAADIVVTKYKMASEITNRELTN